MATELAPENEPQSPDREGGRCITAWMPHEKEPEEMEPESSGWQAAATRVQSVRRVSVAEQGGCCQRQVDVEPLAYHFLKGR